MVASTGSSTRSSSTSSMAAGRAADRSSVAGYSGKSPASSSSSMAAARTADRNSVAGYTSKSSFASSTAAARTADRNSVAGYSKASPGGSMAQARVADRASVPGYDGRSSFAASTATARAADRNSVIGYTHGSLKKGMQSDAVKSLQQRLSSSGYDVGAIDGKFGNRTAQALRSYQKANGLGVDGVAGQKTFNAMNGFNGVNSTSTVGAPVGGKVSTQLADRGVGFTTYGPRNMQYGTQQTVKNLNDIAARYHARTGRTLEIGDLAKQNGGKTSRHKTHLNGTDVDLRPPSTTGGPATWKSPGYDRTATRALIQEVKRTNPNAKVLFNDPVLRREGLTHYAKGHDNHLHVSFR